MFRVYGLGHLGRLSGIVGRKATQRNETKRGKQNKVGLRLAAVVLFLHVGLPVELVGDYSIHFVGISYGV